MSRLSALDERSVLFRTSLWFIFLVMGFLLISALPARAQNGYPPRGDPYINDFAKVIDAEDASNLRQALADLKSSKGIELAVVTVNSIKDYPTGDGTIESFATHLFNTWGIGDAQLNKGVMLLVAVKDHELRVELGKSYGNGHSAEMQSIIDNTIVPDFKQGAYSRGIYRGVKAIVDQLTGVAPKPSTSTASSPQPDATGENALSAVSGTVLLAIMALIAIVAVALKTKGRSGSRSSTGGDSDWSSTSGGFDSSSGSSSGGSSDGGGASGSW